MNNLDLFSGNCPMSQVYITPECFEKWGYRHLQAEADEKGPSPDIRSSEALWLREFFKFTIIFIKLVTTH